MKARVIVNGSFRSGTSYIWNDLKKNNNGVILYEPCHENLLNLLKKVNTSSVDKLHGLRIWSEYNKNHIDFIERDGISNFYNYKSGVVSYASGLCDTSQGIIGLQTNRWHLFYDELIYAGYNVIHIIRNPNDVYRSIINSYRAQGSGFIKLLKRILPDNIVNRRAFKIKSWYEYTLDNLQLKNDAKLKTDLAYEMFVITWILQNYKAISSLNKHGLSNNVIVYDLILNNKTQYIEMLNQNELTVVFDNFKFKSKGIEKQFGLYETAKKFGLTSELNLIWEVYLEQKSSSVI